MKVSYTQQIKVTGNNTQAMIQVEFEDPTEVTKVIEIIKKLEENS
jgi:hypothetical protein